MASLIINSTATRNNGDVALILALGTALENRGHTVTFATPHPGYMQMLNGRSNVCAEVLGYTSRLFRRRFMADISALWCLLFSKAYRDADAIIGAPGGYLNSYYGFTWRKVIYRWSHLFGKKTAIYSQSVGPLRQCDGDSLASLDLDLLVTRDNLSTEIAMASGFPADRILPSIDAVFLALPTISLESASSNVVGISVREWSFDGRDVDRYVGMMCRLGNALLARGFAIEFVSTCQGIPGYIDDSSLATAIADRLRLAYGPGIAVTVIRSAMGIDDLRARISGYRLVLGTRLHMCLLALLSGVPAFNVSYESKGGECYGYLGLDRYTVDYNCDTDTAETRFVNFLDSESEIRDQLPALVRAQHQRASRDLDFFIAHLGL